MKNTILDGCNTVVLYYKSGYSCNFISSRYQVASLARCLPMQVSSTLSSFPTRRVLIQPCWTPWGHYNNDNDGNQWWSSWATPMFTTSVWSSLNHYHHHQQCYHPDTNAKAVSWELSYFDPHIIIWWSSCHNMMVNIWGSPFDNVLPRRCLEKDPEKRATVQQLLSHPYLRQIH